MADLKLLQKLDELTLNLKDLLPEDEGDAVVISTDDWEDEYEGTDATYCPECEAVFEFGEDGYLGSTCIECGGICLYEIEWVDLNPADTEGLT